MSLDASIPPAMKRMRQCAHELDGFLNELKKLLPANETTRQAYMNARRTIGFIHTEITGVETTCGAGVMTGELPRPTTARDLDMHPVNLPKQVERDKLLESLHRAGDHTQDPDTDTEERSAA